MKKNKEINAAVCDARSVTEESLEGYENITINSAVLVTDERSTEILNRYPVTLNAATLLDIPQGEKVSLKMANGKGEIGPETDGTGVVLLVNGKLIIANDSKEAVKTYYRILVNGKVLMPRSYEGMFGNLQVNGKTAYYPDGATLLKADQEMDDLFVQRAANTLYYCPGNLFFLDPALDTELVKRKDMKFSAGKIVVAENLLGRLISQFDEEPEIVKVPEGCRLIDDDVDLKLKTIRKYGSRLCVTGDVSIADGEALAALEYLYSDGTVTVNGELEDAFDEIECVCEDVKILDPDMGYVTDRSLVKIGPMMLNRYPKGVKVEDCAKVNLSEELDPQAILDKLKISDCALVVCSKAQEEAVNMIAEDVARIRVADKEDPDEDEEGSENAGVLKDLFGRAKDTQIINAVEYKL